MTAIAADELAWHYRMINASIAALRIKRDCSPVAPAIPPAPPRPGTPMLAPDAPGYHAIGLKSPPTCFLGGLRDINAGFLGETIDGFVILAFRGTLAPAEYATDSLAICLDWTQSRAFEHKPWSDGSDAHYGSVCDGFSTALMSLWSDIETALAAMNLPDKNGVWIAGHSKGGAMAALAATRLRQLYPQEKLLPRVVTFGAPIVGDMTFKETYREAGLYANTVRYLNQYDVVPQAPSWATPPMYFIPGCTAIQVTTPPQRDVQVVGELRYICRDSTTGRYDINVGLGEFEVEYINSAMVGAKDPVLAGAAHNPFGNYLNCFRLYDDGG